MRFGNLWIHKAVVASALVFAGYTLVGMCWSIYEYRVECARVDRLLDELEENRMKLLLLELEELRQRRADAEFRQAIEPVGEDGWSRMKTGVL